MWTFLSYQMTTYLPSSWSLDCEFYHLDYNLPIKLLITSLWTLLPHLDDNLPIKLLITRLWNLLPHLAGNLPAKFLITRLCTLFSSREENRPQSTIPFPTHVTAATTQTVTLRIGFTSKCFSDDTPGACKVKQKFCTHVASYVEWLLSPFSALKMEAVYLSETLIIYVRVCTTAARTSDLINKYVWQCVV
jgi:hypothetical protein